MAFAHERYVASFLIDPREMTIGEYQSNFTLPPALAAKQEPADHAMHGLTWSMAMAYAEKMGKRLPEENEYEAAATDYGRTKYPWGEEDRITEWGLGKTGLPAFDRTRTTPPVEGLYSNVAEWTVSWAAPYPRERNLGLNPQAGLKRIARGAPTAVIDGKPVGATTEYEPRERPAFEQARSLPGLGFRCARSAQPRLQSEDFSRIVAEK
jgi:formylglycine-generating enzyme required for sulfatase activity